MKILSQSHETAVKRQKMGNGKCGLIGRMRENHEMIEQAAPVCEIPGHGCQLSIQIGRIGLNRGEKRFGGTKNKKSMGDERLELRKPRDFLMQESHKRVETLINGYGDAIESEQCCLEQHNSCHQKVPFQMAVNGFETRVIEDESRSGGGRCFGLQLLLPNLPE